MRIVHVTDVYAPGVGGIERQVQSLVEQQRADGHDVVVVTTAAGAMAARGTDDVAVCATLPPGPAPDVVHGHLSVLSPLTLRVTSRAARRGIPVVLTVHSLWPPRPVPLRPVLRVLGGVPAPAVWSAVSRVAAARVQAAVHRPVHVAPNGIDTAWWARASRVPTAGRRDDLHVVLVNRLATRKRAGRFLAALGRAMPAGVRVTVVGDGPRRGDLETTIRRLGLGDQVRLTGVLPPAGIREVLHDADLFVAPSRLESFGIAALEARAAGVPVLGFAGTGIADLVRDGHDGRLVGSDVEMADAVRAFARRPQRLAALQRPALSAPPAADITASVRAAHALYRIARGAPAVESIDPAADPARDGYPEPPGHGPAVGTVR